MRVLCDTNIISELMRPVPYPSVEQWLNNQSITLFIIFIQARQRFARFHLALQQIWSLESNMEYWTSGLEMSTPSLDFWSPIWNIGPQPPLGSTN
jgi:predicted nucleic acid-binding protein